MKTIMIVDDEKYIRFIYRKVVSASCNSVFRVIEASDAVDAVEKIIEEKIDLVLLDIRMPNVDGPQLFKVIRDYNPNIRILVASVYGIEHQKKMIPSADGYYDKSEGIMALLEKIAGMFQEAELEARVY